MTLADTTLRDLFVALDEGARKALLAHVMMGATSPESWALIRWLRRRLKAKARAGKGY